MADRAEEIVIGFGADETMTFRLLWAQAPQTCEAITAALPFRGEASHATHSGPGAVVFLEAELPVPPEHVTVTPAVGELLYTHYPARWRRGYLAQTSEIYWFHATGGRPTVPGLFVPAMASVFAEPSGSSQELRSFCDWSALLNREGWKPISIEAR